MVFGLLQARSCRWGGDVGRGRLRWADLPAPFPPPPFFFFFFFFFFFAPKPNGAEGSAEHTARGGESCWCDRTGARERVPPTARPTAVERPDVRLPGHDRAAAAVPEDGSRARGSRGRRVQGAGAETAVRRRTRGRRRHPLGRGAPRSLDARAVSAITPAVQRLRYQPASRAKHQPDSSPPPRWSVSLTRPRMTARKQAPRTPVDVRRGTRLAAALDRDARRPCSGRASASAIDEKPMAIAAGPGGPARRQPAPALRVGRPERLSGRALPVAAGRSSAGRPPRTRRPEPARSVVARARVPRRPKGTPSAAGRLARDGSEHGRPRCGYMVRLPLSRPDKTSAGCAGARSARTRTVRTRISSSSAKAPPGHPVPEAAAATCSAHRSASGRPRAPTPAGDFTVRSQADRATPSPFYGPVAFGTSARVGCAHRLARTAASSASTEPTQPEPDPWPRLARLHPPAQRATSCASRELMPVGTPLTVRSAGLRLPVSVV